MMENSILLNEIRLLVKAFGKFIVKNRREFFPPFFIVLKSNFLYDFAAREREIEKIEGLQRQLGTTQSYRLEK